MSYQVRELILSYGLRMKQFVINSLAPSEVLKISVDEEEHMDIVVDEANLAQAIGRGRQNVRLASDLTGWNLNIISESESVEKENQEIHKSINLFVNKLDVERKLLITMPSRLLIS